MQLAHRDLIIVDYIAHFSQLTSNHIRSLVFDDLSSHTPASRALNKLVDAGYLARMDLTLMVGTRGRGRSIYELGPRGKQMYPKAVRRRTDLVNLLHTMDIADCFVMFKDLERRGKLEIKDYLTEPDTYLLIGGNDIRPDLTIDLERPGLAIRFMIETDRGSQGQKQILGKLVSYWNGRDKATREQWREPTLVVFVTIDDRRADKLRGWIGQGTKEQQKLFRVWTLDQLEQELS